MSVSPTSNSGSTLSTPSASCLACSPLGIAVVSWYGLLTNPIGRETNIWVRRLPSHIRGVRSLSCSDVRFSNDGKASTSPLGNFGCSLEPGPQATFSGKGTGRQEHAWHAPSARYLAALARGG